MLLTGELYFQVGYLLHLLQSFLSNSKFSMQMYTTLHSIEVLFLRFSLLSGLELLRVEPLL